jgi:hypothetical protein
MVTLKEDTMKLPKTRVPNNIMRYRGLTSSGDISEFIKDTAEDVVTILSIVNENTDSINELRSITSIENKFLYERVLELETQLRDKENQLLIGNDRDIYVTANNARMISSNNIPATLSKEFQQILPTELVYYPKLYLQDVIMKKNILPESLNINISQKYRNSQGAEIDPVTIEGDMIMTENDIANAIDGDDISCWQRTT